MAPESRAESSSQFKLAARPTGPMAHPLGPQFLLLLKLLLKAVAESDRKHGIYFEKL